MSSPSSPANEGNNLPTFVHSRLENKPHAFRLIQLFPASDTGQDVFCELVPTDLEELPKYKALSYVWGDAASTRNIYIEGKPYPVTKNCYAALVCLRHQANQMTLWIDAICINQSDLVERNQQVNMMGNIYSKAEETLIWMGLNNTPGNLVSSLDKLRCVEKLAVNTIIDLTSSSDLNDPKARYNAILIEPAESEVLMVWAALIEIFRHTWWTRLWVHQELVVAQKATVVVGLHAFAWEAFLPLQEILEAIGWDSAAGFTELPRNVVIVYCNLLDSCGYQSLVFRSLARENEQLRLPRNQQRNLDIASGKLSRDDPEMLDLDARVAIDSLCSTRRYHCADPRDHVFALRGLLNDGEILAKADYTISTKELYARFARSFISIYQSTNILRLAGLTWRSLSSSDGLGVCPSWVPYLGTIDYIDYSLDKVSRPLTDFNRRVHFRAAKGLGRARESTIAENDEELSVFGYPVDVLDLLQPFFVEVSNMTLDDFIRSVWQELPPNLPLSYPTGCDPKHALLRVLIGNQHLEKGSMSPCQKWVSDIIAWIENEGSLYEQRVPEIFVDNQHSPVAPSSMVPAPSTSKNMLRPPGLQKIALEMKTSIKVATTGRKFLRTKRGFMGLAPQPAEVGDEVWILLGCEVPMLLRKCDDYYILVGECFVVGMMEGEQTKDLLASGPPTNIILH
jgi:Heterokaryon incompatibility protein (HET)